MIFFPVSGRNKDLREKVVMQTILKTGMFGFLKKIENERVYQTASPDFQKFNKP